MNDKKQTGETVMHIIELNDVELELILAGLKIGVIDTNLKKYPSQLELLQRTIKHIERQLTKRGNNND